MTLLACCDKVDITSGSTYVMFGKHKYYVHIQFCKACGSKKARSHITHVKEYSEES